MSESSDLAPFFDRVEYPFYVVTVRSPDAEMSGCLAGFVTQCSIDPPNFLVCVSKVNHTLSVAERSPGMGLHLLGADQVDLARLFGEETGTGSTSSRRSIGASAPRGRPCWWSRRSAWRARSWGTSRSETTRRSW